MPQRVFVAHTVGAVPPSLMSIDVLHPAVPGILKTADMHSCAASSLNLQSSSA
jgi:hypothetical protein